MLKVQPSEFENLQAPSSMTGIWSSRWQHATDFRYHYTEAASQHFFANWVARFMVLLMVPNPSAYRDSIIIPSGWLTSKVGFWWTSEQWSKARSWSKPCCIALWADALTLTCGPQVFWWLIWPQRSVITVLNPLKVLGWMIAWFSEGDCSRLCLLGRRWMTRP